jgi:hypothetical protein
MNRKNRRFSSRNRSSSETKHPTETDNDRSRRGASTVKVEHSGASNTFTARSERYNEKSVTLIREEFHRA